MTVIMRWSHAAKGDTSKRSDLATPQIARTGLDDVWNPVNGKRYTCSRAFERDVKAAGCSIAGNDSSVMNAKPKQLAPVPGLKEDISRAIDQLS